MEIPEIIKNTPDFRKHKNMIPTQFLIYLYRSYKIVMSFTDNDNFIRLNKINGNL